jgi:hypothetical protein
MKKEKITLSVEVEIEYDESKEGSREHVISSALQDCKSDIFGIGNHGFYRARSIKSELKSD